MIDPNPRVTDRQPPLFYVQPYQRQMMTHSQEELVPRKEDLGDGEEEVTGLEILQKIAKATK